MPRSRASSGQRTPQRLRPVQPPQQIIRTLERVELPPIVKWRDVGRVARALGETASGDPESLEVPLRAVLNDLIGPLELLFDLQPLAAGAIAGQHFAQTTLASRIADIASQWPEATRAGRLARESVTESQVIFRNDRPEPHAPSVIDEGEVAILIAAAACFTGQLSEADAIDTLVGLTILAEPINRLLTALEHGGHMDVAQEMSWLAGLTRVDAASNIVNCSISPLFGPQRTMGGQLPMPVPGLPPGGTTGIPKPKGPGQELVGWLKGKLKGPRRWDPETLDHKPIRISNPGWDVDMNRIRCEIWLAKILIDMKEPPPVRPTRVVWSDVITSIEQSGACVGDRVVIRGKGFVSPKPTGVGLSIPINGVCTPMDVNPADWSNTRIELTLPPGVTSGPIGLVDLNYVKQYNAWVDRQNARRKSAMDQARCARVMPPNIPVLPYFSECAPQTPHNRLRAGTAIIKAFLVNGTALAVVEPSDSIALAWEVINVEQLTVQRISAVGPLFAGSTTLVNPPATGLHAFGASSHTGPARYVYRLTAVGPCGTVTAEVTVIGTRHPQLRIQTIEVTQGLQTTAGNIRYVAQKPTVVRVTIGHGLAGWGANAVPKVTGRARINRSGDVSAWFDPVNGSAPIAATPGASITVPANPQRTNTNDTLNFLLPAFQCVGTGIVEVEVRVNGFDASPGFAGHSQTVARWAGPITFENRRAWELRYIRVNWGGSTPTNATCDATLRASIPLLPLPTVVVAPLAGVGVQIPSATTPAGRNDLLDDFDDRHNCSIWGALTELLGFDCPDDDGAIWVLIPGVTFQGRAFDIPSNVCFTPPNDGPYAAHELAHCFNQQHLGVVCANTQQAQGGDAAASWPNGGLLADVPFDITTNATVVGNGSGVWDLMTYCGTPTVGGGGVNNTWPTPQRWQQLWDSIGS